MSMSSDDKKTPIIVVALLIYASVSFGLLVWTDHIENMEAIRAGLVQDAKGHWVKPAPLPAVEAQQ